MQTRLPRQQESCFNVKFRCCNDVQFLNIYYLACRYLYLIVVGGVNELHLSLSSFLKPKICAFSSLNKRFSKKQVIQAIFFWVAGYERTRTSTCFLSYSRWANKWCMSIITKIPVIVFSVTLTKPFLAWLLLFVPDSGYHAAFCSLHDLFLFKQFQEPP